MTHKVKQFIALSIFSIFSSLLFSQIFPDDYVSRIWNAADGLPGANVTDIIQSHDGYIYLGTYDGLVRFDGIHFTVLDKNSLPNLNCVSARVVFEDTKNNLWIGSNDEGVAKISKDEITMYTIAEGLPNNSVRDIVEDKYGNVWIGTADGVVYIDSEGKCNVPQGLKDYESNPIVISMYCDTAGRIWLVTAKTNGIYFFSSGRFNQFTGFEKYEKINVTAVGQDMAGDILFGILNHGVVKVVNGEIIPLEDNGLLEGKMVNEIYKDKTSALWFATDKGVYLRKGGVFYSYTVKQGLCDNTVNHILEDREGNIWFVTDRGGVEKMSMGKFRTENMGVSVNAIAQNPETKAIWLGTDDGLRCYEKNKFVENELTKMTKGVRIRHIDFTSNSDMLVSAYSKYGQMRVSKDGVKYWTEKEGLSGEKTRVAIEDKNMNLWIGTTTGLSVISPDGAIKNYYKDDGLNNDYIMAIYEDFEGDIWIGTDGGGLNVMRNGEIIKSFTTADGLAGNVIFKIIQDRRKNYWICTGTGLSFYDGEKFFNFDASCGLGSNSIFQIIEDYTGTVWMTSNRGISSVPIDDFYKFMEGSIKSLDVKLFTRNDGLKTGGVTSTSLSASDSEGRLYFTLIDGFALFDLIKSLSNKVSPIVHVESIVADDVKYDKISDETEIVLPPGTRRIDINYSGLSYVSIELVRFKSRLEGFDKDYSDLKSARSVSYTNLKPGMYKFMVLASNSDGFWTEKPATVKFRVKPFFYQMPIFWIFFALCIIVLILLAFKIYSNRQKTIQLQLETMVQMKTVDLEIEKDKSDSLLRNILPDKIAGILKENQFGNQTIAEKFDNVSVLFSDIVGFTAITSNQSADDIVSALNDLFSRFDVRAKDMGIEKIKTIGDAYMAVCGLPEPNPNHAKLMLEFARGMYKDLAEYNKTAKIPFNVRIGINSGSVVAGVIGKTKFIYDLWGDTVNVASRMESLCEPGHIMVAESFKQLIEDEIKFDSENEYDVKGKGKMKTFLMNCP